MREVEFRIPRPCDPARIEEIAERVCSARGLRCALKGTLAKYPGSVHWHYKKGKQSGTLELTLDPLRRKLWATVQMGRQAPWIDTAIPVIRREIEEELSAIGEQSTEERWRHNQR